MKFTGHSRSRVFAAAQVLAVLLLAFSLPAWARSLRVAKFATTIHVEEDGSAHVNEQITYTFTGQYQGVYRDIPVDYPGPSGSNYTLFIKLLSVTDESGEKLKVEKKTTGGFLHLKIYVPGATDATRTVNIEYSVANGTRFFEDHDEFYWNVTGNDSPVPIEQASAMIYFPPEASGQLRAQAFEGVYGSSQHASASVTGPSVNVETTDPLPMRGGLTADVYIEKGVLHQPSAITRFFRFIRSNPVVTLPLWAFAVMLPMWWMKGRDPDPGMSVAPMYAPPEQMGPAEVGTLIDGSVDPKDITSVLIDMAVRGYVKIVETQHKGFLSSKDYEFQLLKDQGDWKGLTDYERAMLQQVFSGGQVTLLSNLTNHFYTALPMIKSEIMSALKAKGMYAVDPDSAHGYLAMGLLLVGLPYAALQVFGFADFLSSVPLAIGSGLIALAIILIIGRLLTATSLKGARTQVQIKGFQEFMNRVDADRLKRMPPDTFEKFLPYAMALGVEHRWAKAFEGIVQNPPTWYQGYGPSPSFSTFYFVNSLGSMATTASSTFVSAPRASSSGSGWSGGGGGGGFSGGGFGGGGTGGF